MEGSAAVLENPTLETSQLSEIDNSIFTDLPLAARAGEIKSARFGKERKFRSFQEELSARAEKSSQPVNSDQKREAVQLFKEVSAQTTDIEKIILEMKRLGIRDDLLLSPEFKLLRYAIKTDQWGDRPDFDYPKIDDENYVPDPENPLNQISVEGGQIKIDTLREGLYTDRLIPLLQKFYDSAQSQTTQQLLADNPTLRSFVEQQAISRNILTDKDLLKINTLDLGEAKFVKNLTKGEDAKQLSNPVEIWESPNGRRMIVKEGPPHTLNAEILEQRFMELLGIPVPETTIQNKSDGTPVLVVGFLEGYHDDEDPFQLSEKYHTSAVLQQGLILDLWLNQYNRRAHNVMMKDGKVSFIDHGGAVFCRSTGGFKEFSPEITTANLWDLLRTIPDDDPNGDVPVNEAYTNLMTIEGGVNGNLVVKNPNAIRLQLQRLSRITDQQIEDIVSESGYQDGEESIEQIKNWLDSENIQGRIAKLEAKDPSQRTEKDTRDLRWTKDIKARFEAVKLRAETVKQEATSKGLDDVEIPGLKTFMVDTLKLRRDNLVSVIGSELSFDEKERDQQLKREISERFWAASDLSSAADEAGTFNTLATVEILIKSLTDPGSIPETGYGSNIKQETVDRLREPLVNFPKAEELADDVLKLDSILRETLIKLIETEPVINHGAVEALAEIAAKESLSIWTVGDVDNRDVIPNSLPEGLLSSGDTLIGSGQQLRKLELVRLKHRIEIMASKQSGKDVKVVEEASSDKFTSLPLIIDKLRTKDEEAAQREQFHLVIFDDTFASLEKAKSALDSMPVGDRPKYSLVLINQGRKYTETPQTIDINDGKGEYTILSASSKGVNDAILKTPQFVSNIRADGSVPTVLMDFDGVITDNSAVRKSQEDALFSVLSPHIL